MDGRLKFSSYALAAAVVGFTGNADALDPPQLPELDGIVKDERWARVLGKALFWDERAGSDGMACASCHFSAGADSRITNQLNPNTNAVQPDSSFGNTEAHTADLLGRLAAGEGGPNYTLQADDFPLHQLMDEEDRNSEIRSTTNDRVASSGSFHAGFDGSFGNSGKEKCGDVDPGVFHAGGYAARAVEPRHTPTVINAVYYHRNFWDGRANNVFNGVDPFGLRSIEFDPTARIVVADGARSVGLERFAVENASLASQAVAPPLSNDEMSCNGRPFAEVGRRLLSRAHRPLEAQAVHPNDSLLGSHGPFGDLRHAGGKGLAIDYGELIRRAFDERFWQGKGRFVITPDGRLVQDQNSGYTQAELNFSMFWGISIMLYEATLISDDSKFDRVQRGEAEFTEQEALGQRLFGFNGPNLPSGRCVACHGGDLFSAATFTEGERFTEVLRVGGYRGPEGDLKADVMHDSGFFNIGVRPTGQDLGVGGTDPYGNPLSFTRQFLTFMVAARARRWTRSTWWTAATRGWRRSSVVRSGANVPTVIPRTSMPMPSG